MLARVRAAALHTGVMRDAIHHLKYADGRGLAVPLARYLAAAWAEPDWDDVRGRVDLVAPVPLHDSRLQERGYNQSALLAKGFCDRTGLTCMPDALARVRATQSQVGLDASARAVNVADAFAARLRLDGVTVLLIDDVYTTGATLNACARAALAAGALQVVALTLALPASRGQERRNVPQLG
ncbi:MAG: phosphoribosyltransferase family protein [Caldilineaceae bacterium]